MAKNIILTVRLKAEDEPIKKAQVRKKFIEKESKAFGVSEAHVIRVLVDALMAERVGK